MIYTVWLDLVNLILRLLTLVLHLEVYCHGT